MAGGEDWLMRPVRKNMCRYTDLKDCSVDLFDLAVMNEAIDVDEENELLIKRAIHGSK